MKTVEVVPPTRFCNGPTAQLTTRSPNQPFADTYNQARRQGGGGGRGAIAPLSIFFLKTWGGGGAMIPYPIMIFLWNFF